MVSTILKMATLLGRAISVLSYSVWTLPTPTVAPSLARHYKIKAALKKRCRFCMFVARKGKLRIICKNKGRHKQRQL